MKILILGIMQAFWNINLLNAGKFTFLSLILNNFKEIPNSWKAIEIPH
jgi:hypothetical protein